MEVTRETARRYLLGRSGLWPGRRWAGKEGVAAAVRTLGAVQVDPLNVVGRNHDLVLQARVVDYRPVYLDELAYGERQFFDYGGTLFLYPMEELPYWRLHMRRQAGVPHWQHVAAAHADALEQVKGELRARGPLGNRDFAGNARVNSYRGSKDTGVALYYLWLTGELMTHGRRDFQRLFGFREDIAPPETDWEPSEAEAEVFFARKSLARHGLATAGEWAGSFAYYTGRRGYLVGGGMRAEARRTLDRLVEEGVAARLTLEGSKEPRYVPAAELPLLETLAADGTPEEWRPVDTTTADEVTLLAPLDDLLHRQRARLLFDFEYIWEVYKPAHQRRWGYYTLPILWDDRLVARIDLKLDRKTGTLAINGFWLEDASLGDQPAFLAALARGLARFASYLDARCTELVATNLPADLADAIAQCAPGSGRPTPRPPPSQGGGA